MLAKKKECSSQKIILVRHRVLCYFIAVAVCLPKIIIVYYAIWQVSALVVVHRFRDGVSVTAAREKTHCFEFIINCFVLSAVQSVPSFHCM